MGSSISVWAAGGLLVGMITLGPVTMAQSPDGERRPVAAEIDAGCWYNAQPVRLYDSPDAFLLVFWSTRSRESRELMEELQKLHRLYASKGLLIVALTEDDCQTAHRFVRHKEIQYEIGADSRTLKRYKVKELPAIVLVDAANQEVVGRWSGRRLSLEPVMESIVGLIGAPPGAVDIREVPTPEEVAYWQKADEDAGRALKEQTASILAVEGEIGPEHLGPLERYYEEHLRAANAPDDITTRTTDFGRSLLFIADESGYIKLLTSGRLNEAGRAAIYDRIIEIARTDPDFTLREEAVMSLAGYGSVGDPTLLEALRDMREPLVATEDRRDETLRLAIDEALLRLDPATAEQARWPNAGQLSVRLRKTSDPSSLGWSDAHAYLQTVQQRTPEELLADYRSFRDPPDDEIKQQNARIKRLAAMDELGDPIRNGAFRDLWGLTDELGRMLAEEPDMMIRMSIIGNLEQIGEYGGRRLRAKVVALLERHAATESRPLVLSYCKGTLDELKKGKRR